MKDNVKNRSLLRNDLLRTMADPVLIYAVISVMAVMDHYRSSLTAVFGIAAYAFGWCVFRLFDYIQKHRFIGGTAYVAVFLTVLILTKMAIDKGGRDYPISWGLWFLTPQNMLDYNKWYTLAIFMLFTIFLMSVIYYFTRVRYRIFMNFLILIIPFSIYGKENEEMKIGYMIALCVGFIVVMAAIRQMSDSADSVAVDKPEMWRSAAVFTVLFALVSAFVPKPHVEADREMIETLIDADALTDRFLSLLNAFSDSSEGDQFRGTVGNAPMYYAVSPQPLRLKTRTFTYYDFEKDSWNADDQDKNYHIENEPPFQVFGDGRITEAVLAAAVYDEEFSKKYGLSELEYSDLTIPKEQNIWIYSANRGGDSAPVPQGALKLESSSFKGEFGLTRSGVVYSHEADFAGDEQFSFSYMPDSFFGYDENRRAAEKIAAVDDYSGMISDSMAILYGRSKYESDEEKAELLSHYYDVLSREVANTIGVYENFTDYGESEKILALAEDITAGLDSDYEKAKALENYFIENDYTYDLDYRKAAGDNTETFLFESKTGVCYEYATAMTLLARAAGIPARYCEGFNMQTEYSSGSWSGYVVTSQDAHGFPELYIKGYGWMTFEPTRTLGDAKEKNTSATGLLVRSGIILLALSVIVLVFIMLSPMLIHGIFLLVVRRRSPDLAVRAVIHRICKLYGCGSGVTVREAAETVKARSGADIKCSVILFEKSEYGGAGLNEGDRTKAVNDYISAYKALKEAKKAERKSRKKSVR